MYYKRLCEWLMVSEVNGKFQELMAEPGIEEKHKRMLEFVSSSIEPEAEKLILAKPDALKDIVDVFTKKFNGCINEYELAPPGERKNTAFGKFKKDMEELYEDFMKSTRRYETFGMQLSRSLNIRTCPYCNRSYTFSIDEKMDEASDKRVKVRPEFDHFYPKSKKPEMSFRYIIFLFYLSLINIAMGKKVLPYPKMAKRNGCH